MVVYYVNYVIIQHVKTFTFNNLEHIIDSEIYEH